MKYFISYLLVFTLSWVSVLPNYHAFAEDTGSSKESTVYSESVDKASVHGTRGEIALGTIIMLATAFAAPLLLKSCPTKPSVMVYAAGAAMFIGFEIYNWANYTKGSDKVMEIYDNAEESDKQLESLTAAGEQTLEAASKTSLKGNFAMSVSITWGVAAVIAGIEAVLTYTGVAPNAGPCIGVASNFHNLKRNETKLFGHQSVEEINIMDKMPPLKEIVEKMESGRNDFETYVLLKEQQRFYKGDVKSMSIDEYEKIKNRDILSYEKSNNVNKLAKSLSSIIDSLIPTAYADTENKVDMGLGISAASIGIIGAVAMTKFSTALATVKATQTTFREAVVRSVGFGVAAGLAGGQTAIIKDAASKLEKQANQYFNLASQLTQANSQITLTTGINQQTQAPIIKPMSSSAAAIAMNGQCFTGGRGKLRTDPSCSCRASKGCKKSGMPTINFEGFKTPNTLKNLVNTNGQITDEFYKGNVQGANMLAEANNNKNAARLKKLNKSVQKTLNSALKKSGKKPIDFDKEIADNRTALFSSVQDKLSSMPGNISNSLSTQDKTKEDAEDKSVRGSGGSVQIKSPASTRSRAKAKKGKKGGDFKFDFDLDDEEEEKTKGMGHSSDSAKRDKELDQYETTQDDISQRSETSLFKIIETRYLKTAYPIFFEEESAQ